MNNENLFKFINPLIFAVDPTVDIPKPKVESLQSQQECNSSQLRWSRNFCVGALICGLQVLQWSLCAPILGVWWGGWLLWWLWWNGLSGENHLHPWRLQVWIVIIHLIYCIHVSCLPFRCTDGSCIPITWQCDGDPECPDGLDEWDQLCSEDF